MAGAEATLSETMMAAGQLQEDARLLVQFLLHPHYLEEQSIKEGRPMYEDREYVKIMVPGDKDNIVFRPIRPNDKFRFPLAYQAFKNNNEGIVNGTPLEAWPAMTRAMVKEMEHFHIRTVEQLAGMSDSNAQNFRGAIDLRARARVFLEMSKDSAAAEKMAAELKSRDNEIDTLKNINAEMLIRLEALEAKKK